MNVKSQKGYYVYIIAIMSIIETAREYNTAIFEANTLHYSTIIFHKYCRYIIRLG